MWEGNDILFTFYLQAYVDNDRSEVAVEILRKMMDEYEIYVVRQVKWTTNKLIDLLIEEGKSPAVIVGWLKQVASDLLRLNKFSKYNYSIDEWANKDIDKMTN